MNAWQPIETAPKDGRRVLTVRGNGYVGIVHHVLVTNPEPTGPGCLSRWVDDAEHRPIAEPTHWMPLPEAPK